MSDTRILVVEDESIVAIDLQHRLEHLGYSVPFVVASGEDAIQRAHETRPDVVLMDIVLKGNMDGIEAAAEIVRRLDIPIVFLTAFGDDHMIERAKALQPLGYILKPFKERELHATIQAGLYRRQIEKRLRESEERFSVALKNAPLVVLNQDRDLRYTWVYNPLGNIPATEIIGKTDQDLFIPEDAERFAAFKRAVIESGMGARAELRLATHDHHAFYYDVTAEAMRDNTDKIIGVMCACLDVTDRKQAEDALRISEERFRVAQELSLDAFTILAAVRDDAGTIIDFRWTYVNPAAGQILRHAPHELIGQRLLQVLPGNAARSDLFVRYVRVVETGEPHDYDVSYNAEGIQGWFRNMTVKLDDGIAICFTDITQRKLMEEQLQRNAQRTEALASISHLLAQAGLALPSILDTITKRVSESIGDVCVISLLSKDGETLVPMAVHHPNSDASEMLRQIFTSTTYRVGGGLAGRVVKTNMPILIPQLAQAELRAALKPEFFPYLERYGLHSTLIVPIRIQEQVIGTLGITRAQPDLEYTQEDQVFLQSIADRAALAIANARLHAQVQRARAELEERVQARTEELHQANQALAENETRFRLLAENAQDLIYRYRLTKPHGFEYVSASATFLTGYTPQEHYADPDLNLKLIHPDDRHYWQALVKGQVLSDPIVLRWQHRDGNIVWTEQRMVIIRDNAGTPIAIQGIARDITARKLAEIALQASEKKYRQLVELAQEGVWTIDVDAKTTFANPHMAEMLGYTVEEMLGRSLFDFMDQRGAELAQRYIEKRKQGIMERHDFEFIRRDGQRIYASLETTPLTDDDGNYVGALALVADTTARKLAEDALSESNENQNAILNSTTDSVFLMDLLGIVLALNESTAQKLGKQTNDLLGKCIYDVLPAEIVSARKKHVAHVIQTGTPVHFVDQRSGRWLDNSIFPISDSKGRVTRLAVYGRDITEQISIEDKIRKAAARTAALVQTAARLNAKLEIQTVLQAVCEEAARSLNVPAAMVALCNDGKDTLHLASAHGLPQEYRERFQIFSLEKYTDLVQNHGPIFVVSHSLSQTDFMPQGVVASLTRDKQLIGILYLMTLASPREFTEDDLELLQGLSDQAALAIDNARIYETAQRRLRQLQTLRGIDQAITANFDLKVTLRLFLLEAISELHIDAISVLLLEPNSQTLVYSVGRGFENDTVEQTRLRLGDGVDGLAVLERRTLCLSQLDVVQNLRQSEWVRAERFVSYCGVPLIAKGKILGVLNLFHRGPLDFAREFLQFVETLAGQVAIAIDNAALFNELERSNAELITAYDTTLEGWSRALDLRDKETEGHTQRVAEMTLKLARAAGMTEAELVHIRRGALLHDIGKIGIPDQILLKPGPLTEEEWVIMRRHTTLANELLSPIPYLHRAIDIPACHHEKWDGTGYPRGLKGDAIPLGARLFAVIDFWDALRSERPYRPAWSEKRVRRLIQESSGTHFDPQVVDLFLQMLGPSSDADTDDSADDQLTPPNSRMHLP